MKIIAPAFEPGDFVRVVRIPADLDDPMGQGTRAVFEGALDKVFQIEGVDEHGRLEIVVSERRPAPDKYESDTIWLEPEFVQRVEAPSL